MKGSIDADLIYFASENSRYHVLTLIKSFISQRRKSMLMKF